MEKVVNAIANGREMNYKINIGEIVEIDGATTNTPQKNIV